MSVDIKDQVAVTSVDEEFVNPNFQRLEGTYLFPLPVGAHIDKFSMDINGKMQEAELLPADKAVVGFEDKNVRPDTDFKLIFTREKNDIGINLLTYRNSPDDGYYVLLASPGMEMKNAKIQPKDICLVLDTSGSMAGKKMEQAKKALAFCLANLNADDRFDIIRFSTEADDFFEALKPANKDNIAKAQTYVESLKPIGGTTIDEALQKAIKLGQGRSDKDKRPCSIIFLTDGQPTIGETGEDAILGNVKKANTDGARIFSFGIGTELNTHLLDRLAEATKSVSQYVIPTEDIEVKLSNFYTKIKDPVLSNVLLSFTGGDVRTSQTYPNTMPDLFKGEMLVAFGRYSGKGPAAVKITGMLNGEKKEFVTDVNFSENDTKNEFIPRLWATRRVGWLLDEIRKNGETAELKDEVVRLARQHGIVTPYTAYLILEDEQRRGVPVAVRTMREFGQDDRAKEAAKAIYDSTVAESKSERNRGGDVAVANAANLDALKRSDNVQQSGQEFALDKGGSFGVGGGRGGSGGGGGNFGGASSGPVTGEGVALTPAPSAKPGDTLALGTTKNGSLTIRGTKADADSSSTAALDPASQPAQGYRANSNYAQQTRVVKGRAFYQNGNTWTDATASTRKDLKKREIKFNSDEYYALLTEHPEAAQWLSLGNEVDVVLDDTLVVVR